MNQFLNFDGDGLGDGMDEEEDMTKNAFTSPQDVFLQATHKRTKPSRPKARPAFPPIKREKLEDGTEVRKVPVPSHRYTPLKENWMKIFEPIVDHLKLQVLENDSFLYSF